MHTVSLRYLTFFVFSFVKKIHNPYCDSVTELCISCNAIMYLSIRMEDTLNSNETTPAAYS